MECPARPSVGRSRAGEADQKDNVCVGGRGSIFEYGRDDRLERHASIITDGDEPVCETEYYD